MFQKLKYSIVKASIPFVFLINNPGDISFFNQNNKEKRRVFTISSDFQFGSNAINTKFASAFLTGSFIDQDLKNGVKKSLQEYNRIGADWNTEISYYNFNDLKLGKKWGYFFQLKNRMYVDGSFSSDAFNLAFSGNKMFENRIARFNSSSAQLVQYQQATVGFMKTIHHKEEKHIIGFSLSYLNGNRNSLAETGASTIFTAPGGEYLDVNADVYLRQNRAEHNGYFANNGNGAALDFFYEAQIDDKTTLSFALNDIGFILWKPNFESLHIDTNIRFQGVYINNIIQASDDFDRFLDTMQSHATTDNMHKPALMFLPARVSLAFTRKFLDGRIALNAGVQFRSQKSYVAYFYAQGVFYPHKNLMLSTSIGYGGYTHLNIGFGIGADFGKGYTMVLQTQNVEGMVPNSFGKAVSASIKISKHF